MKFDLNRILYQLRKHKFIVFGLVFVLFILLFRTRLVIEGLTGMGEYEYLAPIPADNQLSDSVVKAYMIKAPHPTENPTAEQIAQTKNFMKIRATEKELQYYADNGKWPYDSYVLNYIKNRPDFFSKLPPNLRYKNLDDMQKSMNNRNVYENLIMDEESRITPTPLSYQIYKGTAQPPSSATTISNPTSTSSNATSSKNSNYKDFLSLCRKALQ